MWLTGRAEGPPLAGRGRPAAWVTERLGGFAQMVRERTGATPELPGAELLGERAAIAGLARRGPRSCGGSFRSVRTRDGWLGLSLPRADDLDAVPALVSGEAGSEPWPAVARWAAVHETAAAVERSRLLGLAAAGWPRTQPAPPAVVSRPGGTQTCTERPLVVDLTSLWAGPLCSHLLGLAGCTIIKVESSRRLDGARSGPRAFFDLLHAGHASVLVDFADPADMRRLADLLRRASLVLEASRPRALRQVGLIAEDLVASGTSWISITAHGRSENTIGFGDDVAVGAGLNIEDGEDLLPMGDAIADPLTGVAAALASYEALGESRARLIEVSMEGVAAEAARGKTGRHQVRQLHGTWWVETDGGAERIRPPTARMPVQAAVGPGDDTARWLR